MGAEAKRDSEADEVVHPPARLTLFGFAPTPATVSLVARTTSWRMARTARALGLTALVAPLAFLVPPHAPWGAAALSGGLYFALRSWKERFTLRQGTGSCPRCEAPIDLGRMKRLRRPHVVPCDTCHHEPVLDVALEI